MGKNSNAWSIDPGHSTLGFSVRHLTIAHVRGAFRDFAGTLHLDENAAIHSTVSLSIAAKSVDTGHPKRDDDLRSEQFFDAAKFPKLKFQSTSMESLGQGKYKIFGDLTIRDVTQPVIFTVDGPTHHVTDLMGKQRCAVAGSFKLSRKDYGLTWNKLLEGGGAVVSDEVLVQIDAEFTKDK